MFKIYDGRIEFVQWDLDRKIIVSDPTIDEVHFCNKTDDCSLVVEVYELNGQRVANVPNILLQDNWDIRVYGYCGGCYTKQYTRFKVVGRTKPADYIYTETEVKSWEAIEQRCEEILEVAEDLARGATSGKSFMDYESLINELNSADNDKYFNPQHMLIKTLGVPDVWVYEVKEESVPYEYVDDATFAQAITDNVVQVGYYVLSALETQKVNLDDYLPTDAIQDGCGILYKNGKLSIDGASKSLISLKQNGVRPITSATSDYAVKEGVVNSTETLTEEEKSSARTWLGAVGNTEYATTKTHGVIKLYGDSNYGLNIINGGMYVMPAANTAIDRRQAVENPAAQLNQPENKFKPIVPATIDYAVKSVLTKPLLEMTDEEKASAMAWLGVTEIIAELLARIEALEGK